MTLMMACRSQATPLHQLDGVLATFDLVRPGEPTVQAALVGVDDRLELHVSAPLVGTRYLDLLRLASALAAQDPRKAA